MGVHVLVKSNFRVAVGALKSCTKSMLISHAPQFVYAFLMPMMNKLAQCVKTALWYDEILTD